MALYWLLEVNYASVIIEKMLCDSLNENFVKMIQEMATQSMEKLEKVKSYFQRFNCPMTGEVVEWTDIAKNHFDIVMCWSIFKLNCMMDDNMAEMTKDIETRTVENNILANYLLDKKDDMEKKVSKSHHKNFNTSENLRHTLQFLATSGEYEMKKQITKYEAVKDSLNKDRFRNTNLDTVRAHVVPGSDKVTQRLKQCAGIESVN